MQYEILEKLVTYTASTALNVPGFSTQLPTPFPHLQYFWTRFHIKCKIACHCWCLGRIPAQHHRRCRLLKLPSTSPWMLYFVYRLDYSCRFFLSLFLFVWKIGWQAWGFWAYRMPGNQIIDGILSSIHWTYMVGSMYTLRNSLLACSYRKILPFLPNWISPYASSHVHQCPACWK